MLKEILFCGKMVRVGCDEKCEKAFGSNSRPKIQLSDNEDDYEYLTDDEITEPIKINVISEGNDRKPTEPSQYGNRWCVRECERCTMCRLDQELILKDFNKRVKNINEGVNWFDFNK